MDHFLASNGTLTDQELGELVTHFQDHVQKREWSEVEKLVVLSRDVRFRETLRNDGVLEFFLDSCLWPATATDTEENIQPAGLAVRLAGNCCLGSEQVQNYLVEHLDRIQAVLSIPELCGLTIGLLANMVYDEDSDVELSTLLEKGFQETIATILAKGHLDSTHPLYGTALELLDSLAEDDVESKTQNLPASTAAAGALASSLLVKSPDSIQTSHKNQTVEILLRWATVSDIRAELVKNRTEDSCFVLACVYEKTVEQHETELETDTSPEKNIHQTWSRFESILGELASQTAAEKKELASSLDSNQFFGLAMEWARSSTRSALQDKLRATGYLILCNLCTDAFAIAAVHDYKLHETAMSTLRDPDWCKIDDIRTDASTFLANLCQPTANKKLIVDSNIVCELFYENQQIHSALAIRMVRRLISNTKGDDWVKAAANQKSGIPSFEDIVGKLPAQRDIQDELKNAAPSGDVLGSQPQPQAQSPNQQLTKDIGHIYVDLRRQSALVNQFVTVELVQCLVNVVLIGARTRNALDISDGIFGLGLAIQNDQGVADSLAVEAIEALQRASGFGILRQIIEMGKGDATQVAKKVAENSTSVLSVFINVAERNDVSSDVVDEMREVLKLGVRVKLESGS